MNGYAELREIGYVVRRCVHFGEFMCISVCVLFLVSYFVGKVEFLIYLQSISLIFDMLSYLMCGIFLIYQFDN